MRIILETAVDRAQVGPDWRDPARRDDAAPPWAQGGTTPLGVARRAQLGVERSHQTGESIGSQRHEQNQMLIERCKRSTAVSRIIDIAVYGANGHTGQFVLRCAQLAGFSVASVARSAESLAQMRHPAAVQRVAQVDDPTSLERAFAGCAVVINCAGPFLDTALPVAHAALRSGCHYLDVSAEQASSQAVFAQLDAPARAAGRVVIAAAGFYGGLADVLATALAQGKDIDTLTVAIGLDRWWPTVGTRKTGARNTAARLVLAGGRLVPLVAKPSVPDAEFGAPIGPQAMVELPFSEVITLHRHLRINDMQSLFNVAALQDIRDPNTPTPTAANSAGQSNQHFEMQVRVVQGAVTRSATATGRDIYAQTAPLVVEAAKRLLAPGYNRSGALALAQAVDPVDLLRALNGSAFDLRGDVGF